MESECRSGAQLVAYLEGALPVEARQALEAHLAGCPRCREEVSGLRRVRDLLAGLACPSEETLLLLALESGPAPAEWAVHLSRCPYCREAAGALRDAHRAPVAAAPAPLRLGGVLARLPSPVEVPLSQVPAQKDAPPLRLQEQLEEIAVALQFAGHYSGLTVAMALRTVASGPLPGVLVRARREDGKERAEAVTDAEGIARLTLRTLTPARYVVEVEAGKMRAFLIDVTA